MGMLNIEWVNIKYYSSRCFTETLLLQVQCHVTSGSESQASHLPLHFYKPVVMTQKSAIPVCSFIFTVLLSNFCKSKLTFEFRLYLPLPAQMGP